MDFGAYMAIVTAIIAAYFTYRNQLRLRAFELFLNRRYEALNDIEYYIKRLYAIKEELKSKEENQETQKYMIEYSHEGLMLYHKLKGCNFGWPEDPFIETFYAIVNEPIRNPDNIDKLDWISRTLNTLSALHGFAHRRINSEMEDLAYSYISRCFRKLRYKHESSRTVKKKPKN